MNFQFEHLIPSTFSDTSKVWIYQSNRPFSIVEVEAIQEKINNFIKTWKTHGILVKGFGILLFQRFVILMADDTLTQVSGCGIDTSVHFIEEQERKYKVNMFNRQEIAFITNGRIETLPIEQIGIALKNNFINENTLWFNNLVPNKGDFIKQWIGPIAQSYLKGRN